MTWAKAELTPIEWRPQESSWIMMRLLTDN
jgi:hypothetical protein